MLLQVQSRLNDLSDKDTYLKQVMELRGLCVDSNFSAQLLRGLLKQLIDTGTLILDWGYPGGGGAIRLEGCL